MISLLSFICAAKHNIWLTPADVLRLSIQKLKFHTDLPIKLLNIGCIFK